ncbi:MAG: purine-nucleoside phosphorylase [Polyangiaceae bacterium]|nr:purine-nucleoside phosphorylase [Polyangiaceae bacterium]MCK6534647.1 purine-nucleoside phosphorylase [Polyangiaceae bacterium]
MAKDLVEAAARVRALAAPAPQVGVVLGSGLGAFGDSLSGLVKVPYADIPHMPQSSVVGHSGNLCLGKVGEASVACLQGRVHLYEGHDLDRVTFGVRLLSELGCRAVVLTNAAGGIQAGFAPGDLMLIVDHLNLMGRNPLVGRNDDAAGPRFPDMTRAYDPPICAAAREAAAELGVKLQEGVYAGLLGPSYETPAEIRMLRTLGADAVGMSTVPEVLVLRHRGVRVGAMSCITNLGAGLSPTLLDHSEVEATANKTRATFTSLLGKWVEKVARLAS